MCSGGMPCVPQQPATVLLPGLEFQLKSQSFGVDGFSFLVGGVFVDFCFKPFVYVAAPAVII